MSDNLQAEVHSINGRVYLYIHAGQQFLMGGRFDENEALPLEMRYDTAEKIAKAINNQE